MVPPAEGTVAEARAAFAKVPPLEYDLGDYVAYFVGEAAAREGKRTEAVECRLRLLKEMFPGSPLLPYLFHDVAYAAALDNDVAASREAFSLSRGKVVGSRRRRRKGMSARSLPREAGPRRERHRCDLENFSVYTAREAGEPLLRDACGSGVSTASRGMGPVARGSTQSSPRRPHGPGKRNGRGRSSKMRFSVFLRRMFALILDYAEFHRKQGEQRRPPRFWRSIWLRRPRRRIGLEARFLQARVEWKAGRLAEARKVFLEIAEGSALPGTSERARYLAAWIAEDEGDLAGATESYERLRGARDDSIRQEALFRFAYDLYLTGRHDEAIAAFSVGEKGDGGTVERARHHYWKARALRDAGIRLPAWTNSGKASRIGALHLRGTGSMRGIANWAAIVIPAWLCAVAVPSAAQESGAAQGALMLGQENIPLTHVYAREVQQLPELALEGRPLHQISVIVTDRPIPDNMPKTSFAMSQMASAGQIRGLSIDLDAETGAILGGNAYLGAEYFPQFFSQTGGSDYFQVEGFSFAGGELKARLRAAEPQDLLGSESGVSTYGFDATVTAAVTPGAEAAADPGGRCRAEERAARRLQEVPRCPGGRRRGRRQGRHRRQPSRPGNDDRRGIAPGEDHASGRLRRRGCLPRRPEEGLSLRSPRRPLLQRRRRQQHHLHDHGPGGWRLEAGRGIGPPHRELPQRNILARDFQVSHIIGNKIAL